MTKTWTKYPKSKWPLAEWTDLYRSGWGSERIAAKYGTSSATVCRWLRRCGVEMRPPGYARVEPVIARYGPQMLRDAESGMSYAEMTEQYGLAENALRLALRRLGHKRPTGAPRKFSDDVVECWRALHRSGWKPTAIANKYRCCPQLVYRRLAENAS